MAAIAAVAAPRPTGISDVAEMGLKAFAILAKHAQVNTTDPSTAAIFKSPLARMSAFLAALTPLELFSDWAPGRGNAIVQASLSKESSYADSKKSDDSTAANALEDGQSAWISSSGRKHHWGVTFLDRIQVCGILIELKLGFLPEKLEILVDEGTSKEEFRSIHECALSDKSSCAISVAVPSTYARGIKLAFQGTAAGNSNNCVGVSKVQVLCTRPKETYSSSVEALHVLQSWLSAFATSQADIADNALATLCDLATASGSLHSVLLVVQAFLTQPEAILSERVQTAALRLTKAITDCSDAERAAQTEAEYLIPEAERGNHSSGPAYGQVEGAAFDPSESSSGLTFSENNTRVYSSTGSNTHSVLNIGPFTEGKASWAFKLEEDTDSQCSCFGAAIKPVSNSSYEYSSQLYMYRAFNGNAYSLGSCEKYGSDSDKVRKGETIRFEADFEANDGEIRAYINDRDIGVVFHGIKGKEIWPAVAFYSSGRAISIVSAEAPAAVTKSCGLSIRASGSSVVVKAAVPTATNSVVFGKPLDQFLADFEEIDSARVIGKNGVLGAGPESGKAGTADVSHAISMQPPAAASEGAAGELAPFPTGDRREDWTTYVTSRSKRHFSNAAYVSYWVGGAFESVEGSVAFNPVVTKDARKSAEASPVIFEIHSEDKLLWRSAPIHAVDAVESYKVLLRGVRVIWLVTRVVAGNAASDCVWTNPTLRTTQAWGFRGWRNDAAALVDGITGVRRGGDLPLTVVAASTFPSKFHAASFIVQATGALAVQHLRGMRQRFIAPGVDLECPFAVEPADVTIHKLYDFLRLVEKSKNTVEPATVASMIHILTANLRRVIVTGVTAAESSLLVPRKEEEMKATKGKKKEDKDKDKAMGMSASELVLSLTSHIAWLAQWGGGASGRSLAPSSAAPAAAFTDATVQNAAWAFLHLTRSLTFSSKEERLAVVSAAAGASGIVEFQLQWPCEQYDSDGAVIQLETVILQLQLLARNRGLKYRLFGTWPAKVYLVVDVSSELPSFLEADVGELFSNVGLADWWLSNDAADLLPLNLEPAADWDRAGRLPLEPGFGAIRVYPSFTSSFTEVAACLETFLPST